MDIDVLRHAVEQAGFASAGVGFLAGLLFSLNPVAVAAIPVSLAYVTRAREKRTVVLFGAMFILGLIATHVLLGLVAGFGGRWVEGLLGRYWGLVLGPLLVLLGLLWPGWIKLPLPAASFRAKRATGMWGAFALGVPFSVAICPVCTPALVVLIGAIAGIGSPLLGAVVLLAFAAGAFDSDCAGRMGHRLAGGLEAARKLSAPVRGYGRHRHDRLWPLHA